MTALIVPVDVTALCVGAPDVAGQDPGGIAMTLAPMADFSVLPYIAGGSEFNRGPYISARVLANADAFAGAVPLLPGIHLHWALPAGLSHGVLGKDGRQHFPTVPERWLVTRIVVDSATADRPQVSTRSWVIESDRLSAGPTVAVGLQQPTVPMTPVPGQNFRYLGASYDLPGWREAGTAAERLAPFTVTGYGEPTFAGFYPNCCTSFGFLDSLADLTSYRPATATVSYHVAGWYAGRAEDPLRDGDIVTDTNRYGWTWLGPLPPTTTVCSGVISGIEWDPDKEYLADRPAPLTVAVADTGPEALSALMASLLTSDVATAADIERLLNALQFGLLSKSKQVDTQAAFEAAMHEAGFASLKGGSVWSVVAKSDPAEGGDGGNGREDANAQDANAQDANAQGGGGEVALPDALAGDLNALNGLQLEADALTREVQASRQQLFADWYKYLLVLYEPGQVPPALPGQVAAVRAYLEGQAQAITAIAGPGGILGTLNARITAAAAAIRAVLPAALVLKGDTAAPPYREPTDPVLVLNGADVTVTDRRRRAGADIVTASSPGGGSVTPLPCRLDDQLVTGVTLDAGLVKGSSLRVVTATELPGLAVLPEQAPGALLQALLREAILLAPASQPVVAAACAAQAGPGNPAVIDFTGTVRALQAAARQFVEGEAPADVAYSGTAPDPVILHAWRGTPWLPLLLQYAVAFHPMRYIAPAAGGYPPEFINASFRLPADAVDLEYASGEPQALQVYSGSTLLAGGTAADLAGEVERFLTGTGSTDQELAAVLARLRSLPLLAQRLTGAVQAMLMQALVLQMPVNDPLASPPQARFATEIAAAVGDETTVAPLPEESFNPLRTGTLTVRQLRIVDAFGRFKDYHEPSVVLSSALRPPGPLQLPAGTAFLPPRITQAARLLFRWLAASDDHVETNAHPATTPVIGWLVPNWLDRALAIYNTEGTPLGELALSIGDRSVLWTPAPGGAFPPTASLELVFTGQNQHLADFARAVYAHGDASFLGPFFTAIREALDYTLPAAFRENAETAVLAGQPLAIARAGLHLEVPGGTAPSQSWASFAARVLDNAPPDDAGLASVRFPVRLGGPQRLDDSLVGFWTQAGGATDWLTFYAPGTTAARGGVRPPAQDTVTLTPQPRGDGPTVVTLLLDPRGSVHATSGILPAAEIVIPPDHYAAAASLSLAVTTRPVLSAASVATASLALPKVSSGQWSWITVGGQQWHPAPTADAPATAALNYTPQHITEGWLLMQPGDGTTAPGERETRP